jgi:hypothetical protein
VISRNSAAGTCVAPVFFSLAEFDRCALEPLVLDLAQRSDRAWCLPSHPGAAGAGSRLLTAVGRWTGVTKAARRFDPIVDCGTAESPLACDLEGGGELSTLNERLAEEKLIHDPTVRRLCV